MKIRFSTWFAAFALAAVAAFGAGPALADIVVNVDQAATQPLPGILHVDLGRALQRHGRLQLALKLEFLAAIRAAVEVCLHRQLLGLRRTAVDNPGNQIPGLPVGR